MSIIDDFASIKADLARIESDKKPKAVEVTEGKATDWADVYGYTDVQKAYGWPYNTMTAEMFASLQYVRALGQMHDDAAQQLKDGPQPGPQPGQEFVAFWRELKQANSKVDENGYETGD